MRVTQNDQGQTVYELESIVDIAMLPDHLVEHALEVLPTLILTTKLALSAAKSEGNLAKMIEALPRSIDLVDDGKHRVGIGVDGVGEFISVDIRQANDHAA